MSRQTFVWCDKRKASVPKHIVMQERAAAAARTRSDLPCPMIVSDQTEIQSMLDGQIYTSKRAYEQSVRRSGHEIVGNEDVRKHVHLTHPTETPEFQNELAQDIKDAVGQLEAAVDGPNYTPKLGA